MTANPDVPRSNVRVKVSPAATAETIVGVVDGAPGDGTGNGSGDEVNSGEGCEDGVPLRGVTVGDGCAAIGVVAPHAHRSAGAKVATSARE